MVRLRPRTSLEGDRRWHPVLLPFRRRRQHGGDVESLCGRGQYLSLRCAGPADLHQGRCREHLPRARRSRLGGPGQRPALHRRPVPVPRIAPHSALRLRPVAARSGPAAPALGRRRLLPRRCAQLSCRHRKEDPLMLALLRRLLPLALAIPALYAQNALLDCDHPVDVHITSETPIAYVNFPGLPGDTVYIRLLATTTDPRFS